MAEAQSRHQELAGVQAAGEAGRGALAQVTETGRGLLSSWTSGTEATLRATFDIQNAAIQAGLSVSDAIAAGNREAVQRWAEVTRQAQDQIMEAWRATVHTAEQTAERARSSEGSRR